MTAPLLLRTRDVALLLGLSVESFYRRRDALHHAGFPQPIPGMGVRYDPEAIKEWIASFRTPAPPAPTGGAPPLDDVAAWQAELDRRIARVAA